MKEDAQLVCPVSYCDRHNIWSIVQKDLCEKLPLREVTWKSSVSSTYTTIDKLPLRFLEEKANLFKDTDHSFRWFLAAYVNIYFLTAETLDAYKLAKADIKKWVEAHGGIRKSPWLIVYVPKGVFTVEVYSKVYSRLSSDFYAERSGDRTVMLIHLPNGPNSAFGLSTLTVKSTYTPSTLSQMSATSFNETLLKIRDGVISSFQHRSALYEADIRRLDSYRGTPQFDFRQLFLVKESLALMYQMMQLPEKALLQYEALEATLHYCPAGFLPDYDWPMISAEGLTKSDLTLTNGAPTYGGAGGNEAVSSNTQVQQREPPQTDTSATPTAAATNNDTKVDPGAGRPSVASVTGSAATPSSLSLKDAVGEACKNGDEVLTYSINTARMRILKNKMSVLELQRYIFARQLFFLISHLHRPVTCAHKGLQFLVTMASAINKKIFEKYGTTTTSTRHTEGESSNAAAAAKIGVADIASTTGAAASGNVFSSSPAGTTNVHPEPNMLELRRYQANIWLVTATVKILRICRDLIVRIQANERHVALQQQQQSMSHNMFSSSYSINAGVVSSASTSISSSSVSGAIMTQSLYSASSGGNSNQLLAAPQVTAEASSSTKGHSNLVNSSLSTPALMDSSKMLCEMLTKLFTSLKQIAVSTFGGEFDKRSVSLAQASPCSTPGPSLEFVMYLMADLEATGFMKADDTLERTLAAMSQKIRSLTGFWSKVIMTGGVGGKSITSNAFGCGDQLSSGSPVTPGLPAVRPVPLSRVDKGRALEVSLGCLAFKAMWELLLQAGRPRHALSAKLSCANLLFSFGAHYPAGVLYEHALSSGLLTNTPYRAPAPPQTILQILATAANVAAATNISATPGHEFTGSQRSISSSSVTSFSSALLQEPAQEKNSDSGEHESESNKAVNKRSKSVGGLTISGPDISAPSQADIVNSSAMTPPSSVPLLHDPGSINSSNSDQSHSRPLSFTLTHRGSLGGGNVPPSTPRYADYSKYSQLSNIGENGCFSLYDTMGLNRLSQSGASSTIPCNITTSDVGAENCYYSGDWSELKAWTLRKLLRSTLDDYGYYMTGRGRFGRDQQSGGSPKGSGARQQQQQQTDMSPALGRKRSNSVNGRELSFCSIADYDFGARYRCLAAQLLSLGITMARFSTLERRQIILPNSVMCDLQKEIVSISSLTSVPPSLTDFDSFTHLRAKTPLVLPLSPFFTVHSLVLNSSHDTALKPLRNSIVKGSLSIQEQFFPVHAIQFEGGHGEMLQSINTPTVFTPGGNNGNNADSGTDTAETRDFYYTIEIDLQCDLEQDFTGLFHGGSSVEVVAEFRKLSADVLSGTVAINMPGTSNESLHFSSVDPSAGLETPQKMTSEGKSAEKATSVADSSSNCDRVGKRDLFFATTQSIISAEKAKPIIKKGRQFVQLCFRPPTLGDFFIYSVSITCGSLIFQSCMLPFRGPGGAFVPPGGTDGTAVVGGKAGIGDSLFAAQSTAVSNSMDELNTTNATTPLSSTPLNGDHQDFNTPIFNSGVGVSTTGSSSTAQKIAAIRGGESLTGFTLHQTDLQNYLDKFNLIRIVRPTSTRSDSQKSDILLPTASNECVITGGSNLADLKAVLPRVLPYGADEVLKVTIQTKPGEFLEGVRFSVRSAVVELKVGGIGTEEDPVNTLHDESVVVSFASPFSQDEEGLDMESDASEDEDEEEPILECSAPSSSSSSSSSSSVADAVDTGAASKTHRWRSATRFIAEGDDVAVRKKTRTIVPTSNPAHSASPLASPRTLELLSSLNHAAESLMSQSTGFANKIDTDYLSEPQHWAMYRTPNDSLCRVSAKKGIGYHSISSDYSTVHEYSGLRLEIPFCVEQSKLGTSSSSPPHISNINCKSHKKFTAADSEDSDLAAAINSPVSPTEECKDLVLIEPYARYVFFQIRLKATLLKEGCWIPFTTTARCWVRTGPIISVHIESTDVVRIMSSQTEFEEQRSCEVFVQSTVRNISPVPIKVLQWKIQQGSLLTSSCCCCRSPVVHGRSNPCSSDYVCIEVLRGPDDVAGSTDENTAAVSSPFITLDPGECFLGAFHIRWLISSTASPAAIIEGLDKFRFWFSYLPMPTERMEQESSRRYCIASTPQSMPAVLKNIGNTDKQQRKEEEYVPNLVRFASQVTLSAQRSMVRVGSIVCARYYLSLFTDSLLLASSKVEKNAQWHWSDGHVNDVTGKTASSSVRSICGITKLSVEVACTDSTNEDNGVCSGAGSNNAWLSLGVSKRELSSCALRTIFSDGSDSSFQTAGIGVSSRSVVFEFDVNLVCIRPGQCEAPPLRVIYSLNDCAIHPRSAMHYPDCCALASGLVGTTIASVPLSCMCIAYHSVQAPDQAPAVSTPAQAQGSESRTLCVIADMESVSSSGATLTDDEEGANRASSNQSPVSTPDRSLRTALNAEAGSSHEETITAIVDTVNDRELFQATVHRSLLVYPDGLTANSNKLFVHLPSPSPASVAVGDGESKDAVCHSLLLLAQMRSVIDV